MQANWSLVLNLLLLLGVVVAIAHMMKERRKNKQVIRQKPAVELTSKVSQDDIIAVRKVPREVKHEQETPVLTAVTTSCLSEPSLNIKPVLSEASAPLEPCVTTLNDEEAPPIMFILLAKDNRQLAGYELLQTLLAAGLRFGEGQLFHRHQHANGQGPVLCSLAAATATGVFDLQNIGAFSVRGLCLFMHASGNSTIDAERFAIMLDTARQLAEGLNAQILDDQRRALSDARLERYKHLLNITDICESVTTA